MARGTLVRSLVRVVGASLGLLLLGACKDLTGDPELPAGSQNADAIHTPSGGMGLYREAVQALGYGVANAALSVGLWTDELQATPLLNAQGQVITGTTSRGAPELDARGSGNNDEPLLQGIRLKALMATVVLGEYPDEVLPAIRGDLYAIRAYAELLLAELYCSGIPLSTVDKEGFTLAPGSTTEAVYRHVMALTDSAIALSADSARILNFARVIQGRTLLNLGDFARAAQAVALVPRGFQYQQSLTWRRNTTNTFGFAAIGNREGGVGLAFLSEGDKRVDTLYVGNNAFGVRLYAPKKYLLATTGTTPTSLILADWIEARLIAAEAQLHAQESGWLDTLNRLRETGITPGLAPLSNPGTDSARVDLLFRERAFWLYLTAHRQGDWRRLIRQYERPVETVYPTGLWGNWGGAGPILYSGRIVWEIGENTDANPLYQGCVSYDA